MSAKLIQPAKATISVIRGGIKAGHINKDSMLAVCADALEKALPPRKKRVIRRDVRTAVR